MNQTFVNAAVRDCGGAAASRSPWPHERRSRFVDAAGVRWHVQTLGKGDPLLLIHGTGSSLLSWRGLAPLLAKSFEVTSFDLPGHGQSGPLQPETMSLAATSAAVGALLRALAIEPKAVVGHSAGMAIAVSMACSKIVTPDDLIGFNAALLPYRGALAGPFSGLAKLFASLPFLPSIAARRARDRAAVERLLSSTGSTLSDDGIRLYQQLFTNERHVRATLSMMANWELGSLLDGIESLRSRIHLIVADGDNAVSPNEATVLRQRYPRIDVSCMRGLGHLAHEERPQEAADLINRIVASGDG